MHEDPTSTILHDVHENVKNDSTNSHEKSYMGQKDYVIECYTANAQSINNKLDELRLTMGIWKPKIVGITKSCATNKTDADIKLTDDYTAIRDDRGRGVILYMHNSLDFVECSELNNIHFEASCWSVVRLNIIDKMLVGCVYRSPNSTREKNKKLLKMMEKIENLNGITHMLIFGDFNFPEINWKTYNVSGGAETIQQQFYELHQACF